jgi:hypothetical protein
MKQELNNLASVFITLTVLLIFSNLHVVGEASENGMHENHGYNERNTSSISEPVVDIEIVPAGIRTGTLASIFFTVKDAKGKPIQDLVISHERIFHIIIISKDFSVFAHLHPEDFGPVTSDMKEKAKYGVKFIFPKAGEYLIAADFAVKDHVFSKHFRVTIPGKPSMDNVKEDFSRDRNFNDYHFRLIAPEHIAAGQKTTLKYQINENGKPITNLEPYLGAPMHLAVILMDLNHFIHAHGYKAGNQSAPHPVGHIHGTTYEHYGPEIWADVIFPEKGTYKIFSEIKHKGKVLRFDFLVNVEK